MRRRSFFLLALAAVAMASLVASASASNVVYPATYTGTASTGGTVELDVTEGGSKVTRFALQAVPVPPCATINGFSTRRTPILDDSFSSSSGLVHFSGSFLIGEQAEGTLTYHRKDGSCSSEEVAWTATAGPLRPTPEPEPPAPPAPQPGPPAPTPVLEPPTLLPLLPSDELPPNTKIKAGPSGTVHEENATLRFAATEAGSTFRCKLDRKPWRACESAWSYHGLRDGLHLFKVKAVDAAGNVDRSPANRRWRVELG